jgi:hypothetical protein
MTARPYDRMTATGNLKTAFRRFYIYTSAAQVTFDTGKAKK